MDQNKWIYLNTKITLDTDKNKRFLKKLKHPTLVDGWSIKIYQRQKLIFYVEVAFYSILSVIYKHVVHKKNWEPVATHGHSTSYHLISGIFSKCRQYSNSLSRETRPRLFPFCRIRPAPPRGGKSNRLQQRFEPATITPRAPARLNTWATSV
jgi:hypothetical protein